MKKLFKVIFFLCAICSLSFFESQAATFDISSYPGIHWNALGLAVNPENGNVFLTSLSYGGGDNLREFTSDGTLLFSTRTFADPRRGGLQNLVVGKDGHLFVNAYESDEGSLVLEMSQDGSTIFSSFSAEQYTIGGGGITYNPTNETLFLSSFRENKVYETSLNGIEINSFDVYPFGGGLIDIAFDPFSEHIFSIHELIYPIGPSSPSRHEIIMLEYGKAFNDNYSLMNAYDLNSAGITKHVLALDMDRSNGIFYVQENNQRIVEFHVDDLDSYPVIPNEGTAGTEFIITSDDFGKGGKVYIGNQKCRVLKWKDSAIRNRVMNRKILPGIYDVTIKPKGDDPIVIEEAFTIRGPKIQSVDPEIATARGKVTIKGWFFGTKKGKAYLFDEQGKKKKCKIRSWKMDIQTGKSEAVVNLPRGLYPGDYDLVVSNKVGSDTLIEGFTIE